jgi:hypothetical protein
MAGPALKRLGSAVLVLSLSACGGGGGGTTPAPPPTVNPFTLTISASGISPTELTVPQGTRVLFVNNGSRRRNMTSDPHPEHEDCPEINNVGTLNTGQSRETGNLNVVRSCGFHDHDDPDNVSVKGRIIIRP